MILPFRNFPDGIGSLMGADAPMPPVAMDSAAPKGAPRRIKEQILSGFRKFHVGKTFVSSLSLLGMPTRRGRSPQERQILPTGFSQYSGVMLL
jgi:hypothetical protein